MGRTQLAVHRQEGIGELNCEVGLGLATAASMGRTLLAVRRQEGMDLDLRIVIQGSSIPVKTAAVLERKGATEAMVEECCRKKSKHCIFAVSGGQKHTFCCFKRSKEL